MEKEKSPVGISSITPFKQEDIQAILKRQIGNVYGVWCSLRDKPFYQNVELQNCFIDCTAGDMELSRKTSPRTFINELRRFNSFPSKLFLIEEKKKVYNRLVENFYKLNEYTDHVEEPLLFDDLELGCCQTFRTPPEIELKKMNMAKFLDNMPPNKYRFGLLYFDPNGFTKEDYLSIFMFMRNNPMLDIILNINASQISRNRGVKKLESMRIKYDGLDLRAIVNKISEYKKYIFIRNNILLERDFGIHPKNKFILLFGTNYKEFKLPKKANFVQFHSEEADDIIEKYNYTANENN